MNRKIFGIAISIFLMLPTVLTPVSVHALTNQVLRLKFGLLYLKLRGCTYQTQINDEEGIKQMMVDYYDYWKYVPITV